MEKIDINVKRELTSHARSMTDFAECRAWCRAWCEEHHENFTDVWFGFVRQAFECGEKVRKKMRYTQAIKNTLRYFPTLELTRIENASDDYLNNFELSEVNGELRLVKAFGVEVRVDNPECCCFALRCRETHKRYDGTEYEHYGLLTTFDFEAVKVDGKEEKNMLWVCGFRLNMGEKYREPYVPSCLLESFEDFIKFYTSTTGDRIPDLNKLAIFDDTPE